jgi:hypothetical protein
VIGGLSFGWYECGGDWRMAFARPVGGKILLYLTLRLMCK